MKVSVNYVLIILLIAVAAISEEESPAPNRFSYNQPDLYTSADNDWIYGDDLSYENLDFYRHSDPLKWDLTKVDWALVDFSNTRVYQNSQIYSISEAYQRDGFYEHLPNEGYSKIDYTRVKYGSKSFDHSKVDTNKYANDLDCKSCSFSFELADQSIESVKYNRYGITQTTGEPPTVTGSVSIANYPSGTQFRVLSDHIVVVLPEEIPAGENLEDYISGDKITIDVDALPAAGMTRIASQRTASYKSHIITGQLSFDDGQSYIRDGDIAIIDNILISTTGLDQTRNSQAKGVNIYFDSEEHQGNYVAIDANTGNMKMNKVAGAADYFEVNFHPDNPIFTNLEEGDNLRFRVGSGSQVSIEPRNKLIPVVKATLKSPGALSIQNGESVVLTAYIPERNHHEVQINRAKEGSTGSVPFTFQVYNEKGRNIMSRQSSSVSRVVFDEVGNSFTLGPNNARSDWECIDCAQNLDFTRKKITAYVKHRAPLFLTKLFNEYAIEDRIQELPAGLAGSYTDIKVFPRTKEGIEALKKECGENAHACASASTGVLYVFEDVSDSTLRHELAHTNTGALRLSPRTKINELRLEKKRAQERSDTVALNQIERKITILEQEEQGRINTQKLMYSNIRINGVLSPQDLVWLRVRSDNQGINYLPESSRPDPLSGENLVVYNCNPSDPACQIEQARDGFVTDYGSTNLEEDYATHAQCYEPECWVEKLDPKSTRYSKKEQNMYLLHFIQTCAAGRIESETCQEMANLNPRFVYEK